MVEDVVNFHMQDCSMSDIDDRTCWGVVGTNFCKNVLLDGCTLSRMDTHCGISGGYTIRRCSLGWAGLTAVGRGNLLLEQSRFHSAHLVEFRSDYGSTWHGNVIVKDCHWAPTGTEQILRLCMFAVKNDGMHDFGYPCSMPCEVSVEGLLVDDAAADYQSMYVFTDPVSGSLTTAASPYPYRTCSKVTLQNVRTASGRSFASAPTEGVVASMFIDGVACPLQREPKLASEQKLGAYWCGVFQQAGVGEEQLRKITQLQNEWLYDGIRTNIGCGRWNERPAAEEHLHCVGANGTYGSAALQAAAVKKVIDRMAMASK